MQNPQIRQSPASHWQTAMGCTGKDGGRAQSSGAGQLDAHISHCPAQLLCRRRLRDARDFMPLWSKRSLQTSREHPASIHPEAWIFHTSNVLSGFILWEEKTVRGLCRGRLIITILFLFSIISLCWIRWIGERFFIPLEIKTEQSKIVRKYCAYESLCKSHRNNTHRDKM